MPESQGIITGVRYYMARDGSVMKNYLSADRVMCFIFLESNKQIKISKNLLSGSKDRGNSVFLSSPWCYFMSNPSLSVVMDWLAF